MCAFPAINDFHHKLQIHLGLCTATRRSGAAGFFVWNSHVKKTVLRLGSVAVFRIPQNPKLVNGFFRDLLIFEKQALQPVDKLFLLCFIIGIIFVR